MHLKNGLLLAALAIIATACTLNEGDPRTTLCQKLTAHLLNSPADSMTWKSNKTVEKEEHSLTVNLQFDKTGQQGSVPMQSRCVYAWINEVDLAAEDPDVYFNEAYYNTPGRVVINNQQAGLRELQKAVLQITGKSIPESARKVDAALQRGAEQLDQAIQQGAQKAGEALERIGRELQNNE